MNEQYNVLIDIVGALLVGAILITELRRKKRPDSVSSQFLRCLMLCCTLVFLVDIPGMLIDGRSFRGARELLWLLDGIYWLLQIVYCWLWLLFADYWSFGSEGHLKKLGFFYSVPMVLELVLVLTTPLTGWIFTIGEGNVYERGSFYLLNMLPYAAYIVAALVVSIRGCCLNTEPEKKQRKISLIVYMFLPVCGTFFDIFAYGLSWVWPMVALSLLMVYLNVQQQIISEEQIAAARLQAELSEGRIAIMLSQIQPHFLYNALNTIKHFCTGNPEAQKIVTDFAKYLRGNMDSLTNRAPIPFSRELEHLGCFLKIEELRFPDVKIEYDIGTTGFLLPALSVQPLVENAIRHGVTQHTEGGTVRISSREEENEFLVCVEDNGVGFVPGAEKNDGRSHIGISNVRSRLESMCGGTLEIESTPGEGTRATIHIPKENGNESNLR